MKRIGVVLLLLLHGCRACREPEKQYMLLSEEEEPLSEVSIKNFHWDLFAYAKDSITKEEVEVMRKKYPQFFPLFTEKIIRVGKPEHVGITYYLNNFTHDPTIREIQKITDSVFMELEQEKSLWGKIFTRYRKLFKTSFIPEIIYFISGFNYAIVCDDSCLAIGLDMFLGKEMKYYALLGIPHYMMEHMRKEYMIRDALYGWIATEMDTLTPPGNVLEYMLYYGKILYALQNLMPEVPDTIIFKYSSRQLKWLKENEKEMWQYFLQRNILYSMEPQEIAKYINDGPFTPGFPEGSPGRAAHWIGYKIILSYVKHHKPKDLLELFSLHDATMILNQSKYKPDEY